MRTHHSLRFAVTSLVALLAVAGCSNRGASSLDADAARKNNTPGQATGGTSAGGVSGSNGKTGKPATTCGNGKLDEGEACDAVLLNGETCVTLGYAGGQLACDPLTCTFDVSMCLQITNGGTGGTGN